MSKKPMNGHGRPGHNRGGVLWLHRSYNNVEKDPEIDKFRTIWQKEHIKEADLAVLAGLANTTVNNMFGGKTVQPRHATFAKMAAALGYKYGLSRDDKPNYDKEIPMAREQRLAYRQQMAKKKQKGR